MPGGWTSGPVASCEHGKVVARPLMGRASTYDRRSGGPLHIGVSSAVLPSGRHSDGRPRRLRAPTAGTAEGRRVRRRKTDRCRLVASSEEATSASSAAEVTVWKGSLEAAAALV